MGMDIQIKPEEVFTNEDRSWLGTRDGMLNCRSISLNSDHFADAHISEKGAVPSGTALALYADNTYGPFLGDGVADANETQVITRTATAGTFTLTFTDPDDDDVTYGPSDAIAASAAGLTAAAVNAALVALGIDDRVVATGAAGGPITLTFGGDWTQQNVPMAVVNSGLATGGTVTIAVGVQGNDGDNFAGHLFSTTKIDKENHAVVGAALFWTGVVKYHKLPTFTGTSAGELSSAAMAAAASIRFEDAMNNRIVAVPA